VPWVRLGCGHSASAKPREPVLLPVLLDRKGLDETTLDRAHEPWSRWLGTTHGYGD
jgi:hypothetical protein